MTIKLLAAALIGAASASATVIGAGQCAGPSGCAGTLSWSNFSGIGTLLAGKTVSVTEPEFNGTLRAAVYRNTSGTLDFYYQFSNGHYSPGSVGLLSATGFAGFTTDVLYRSDNWDGSGTTAVNFRSGTQAPYQASRSAISTVNFTFGTGGYSAMVNPGEVSSTLVIRTNAVAYGSTSTIRLVDGTYENTYSGVFSTTGWAPTLTGAAADVPEPSAPLLFGMGAAYLAIRRRKLRQ